MNTIFSISQIGDIYRKKRTEKWNIKNNLLTEAKATFEKLKTDEKSVLFAEEKINNNLLKKLKKSKYSNDKKS